jgi:hypothetical protein
VSLIYVAINLLMIDNTFMIMVSHKIKKAQDVHVGMVCVMKIVGDTNIFNYDCNIM